MYLPHPTNGARREPGLALRIASLGGVAVALFAILFFRLWYLQVLDGDKYLAEAKNNRTREIQGHGPARRDPRPRRQRPGRQPDQPGAAGRTRRSCPPTRPQRTPSWPRLGELAHMSLQQGAARRCANRARSSRAAPGDAAPGRRLRPRLLPGREPAPSSPASTVQRVFVRHYPEGTLGRPRPRQRRRGRPKKSSKEPRYKGLKPGDEVGKDGRRVHLRPLPARHAGADPIQVNALGEPTPGGQLVSTPPKPGDNLKLTIDPAVQAAGEAALAARGLPGAFVTMNVHNGEILGMGSYPDLRPDGLHQPDDPEPGQRTLPRPGLGAAHRPRHPPASTRPARPSRSSPRWRRSKSGVITPTTTIDDNGSITVGGADVRKRRRRAPTAPLDPGPGAAGLLRRLLLHARAARCGTPAPAAALGAQAGDRPPDRARPARSRRRACCRASSGATSSTRRACTDRPWSAGDNIQLATGQGDLQTNPLQMAIAYAAARQRRHHRHPARRHGSRGRRRPGPAGNRPGAAAPRPDQPGLPHDDPRRPARGRAGPGRHLLRRLRRLPDRRSPARPAPRSARRTRDQSWYVVLAPYPNPKIVTVVTIEEAASAPNRPPRRRCSILDAYYGKPSCNAARAAPTEAVRADVRDPRRQARPEPFATRPASPSGSACPHGLGRWRLPRSAWSPSASSRSARRPWTTSPATPTTTSTARRSTPSSG